jgi:CBS domain-containing protein
MRKLRDIIAGREVICVTATKSVLDAAKLMASKHVGAILITKGKRLEGILTERDVLTRVVVPGRNAATVKVAEIMTRDPVAMSPDKPFSHALLAMSDGGFRHMPVVEDGEAVGVVSIRDAIGAEHEELDRVMETIEHIAGQIR